MRCRGIDLFTVLDDRDCVSQGTQLPKQRVTPGLNKKHPELETGTPSMCHVGQEWTHLGGSSWAGAMGPCA